MDATIPIQIIPYVTMPQQIILVLLHFGPAAQWKTIAALMKISRDASSYLHSVVAIPSIWTQATSQDQNLCQPRACRQWLTTYRMLWMLRDVWMHQYRWTPLEEESMRLKVIQLLFHIVTTFLATSTSLTLWNRATRQPWYSGWIAFMQTWLSLWVMDPIETMPISTSPHPMRGTSLAIWTGSWISNQCMTQKTSSNTLRAFHQTCLKVCQACSQPDQVLNLYCGKAFPMHLVGL